MFLTSVNSPFLVDVAFILELKRESIKNKGKATLTLFVWGFYLGDRYFENQVRKMEQKQSNDKKK